LHSLNPFTELFFVLASNAHHLVNP